MLNRVTCRVNLTKQQIIRFLAEDDANSGEVSIQNLTEFTNSSSLRSLKATARIRLVRNINLGKEKW
jgi:hypothetical protein